MEETGIGKEKLIGGIESEAHEEAKVIVSKAEKESKERISDAERQVKSIIANAKKKGEEQSEIVKRKMLSGIGMEVRRRSMAVKDKVLNDIVNRVKERFNQMLHRPEYKDIIIKWIVEAEIGLGKDKAFVNASKKEMDLIDEDILNKAEKKVKEVTGRSVEIKKFQGPPLKFQGIVVISEDRRMAFNNQISTRILRKQTEIRKLVYNKLFDMS